LFNELKKSDNFTKRDLENRLYTLKKLDKDETIFDLTETNELYSNQVESMDKEIKELVKENEDLVKEIEELRKGKISVQ
jgi:hypothetical protein